MNATFTSWLTPGAAATALSASATILTPISLPSAIDTRPLPRSVGLIRSQFVPLPDTAKLPVRNPRTLPAGSIFCDRSASSMFRFLISSVPLNAGTSPRVASASAVRDPPNTPTLSRRAVVEVGRRRIEIVVRNIFERAVGRLDRRTDSRHGQLTVRGAFDHQPVDDVARQPAREYLRELHRVRLQRVARFERTQRFDSSFDVPVRGTQREARRLDYFDAIGETNRAV